MDAGGVVGRSVGVLVELDVWGRVSARVIGVHHRASEGRSGPLDGGEASVGLCRKGKSEGKGESTSTSNYTVDVI